MTRIRTLGAGVFIVLGLSGCPVTDNYFIEPVQSAVGGAGDTSLAGTSPGAANTGGSDALPEGGTAQSGSGAQAGSGGSGGGTTAGEASFGVAGADTAAGGAAGCVTSTERCNGHDDDCDDLVDELICNSSANNTTGCTGFTLSPESDHGYMLCTNAPKDWTHAQNICAGQDMRLAWLESSEENAAVAATIKKLTSDDILFGATDQGREGDWIWSGNGGFQFWRGNASGGAAAGAFNAWTFNTPNDANSGEDCAVLNPSTAEWGDRSCNATYAFVCEELN